MSVGIYLASTLPKHNKNIIKYFVKYVPKFITNDDVIVIDKYKTKQLEKLTDCKIIKLDRQSLLKNSTSWNDYSSKIKDFFKENHIDKFIYFRHLSLSKDQLKNQLDKNSNTLNLINFVSIRNQYMDLYVIKAAAEFCDYVYQYKTDPMEITLNKLMNVKNFYPLYFFNSNDCKFIPYYAYGCFKENKFTPTSLKEKDFIFSATYVKYNKNSRFHNSGRDYLLKDRDKLNNNSLGLNIRVISTGDRKNQIPQEDYFKLLSKSKYTLIIPPYKKDSFSMMRFVEALSNNCMPFVLKTCDLTDVDEMFPDISEIIRKYMIVNDLKDLANKVHNMSDKNHDKIMNKLLNTQSIKNITDFDYCSKKWNSIIQKKQI